MSRYGNNLSARRHAAVVKSDATVLSPAPFGIYVGGTGDVIIKDIFDTVVTYSAVPAGAILPVVAKSIMNASTATLMVALFDE